MHKAFYTLLLLLMGMVSTSMFAQTVVTVTDADLTSSSDVTWTNDNEYYLDGFVFLESGGKLTIEAGTVIKGIETPSSNDLASTLIIARGAQIFANGTAEEPIIFTTEIDDLTGDLLIGEDRGLWGGLIILGNAAITNDGQVEECVEGLPCDNPNSLYGGNNDTDNSGVIRYVSIRHGGAELAPGEEINGLTLGGVGSGTTIEFVEVFANSDDGIEWFGGTVSVKYASVGFCGDDAMDYDIGWRGNGQFWFVIQGADVADNGGEHDGAKPDSGTPSSNPTIYNATYIGSGIGASANNEHALFFRDGSRGTYANSIFTEYTNFALQVEDVENGVDSYQYMEEGSLNLINNLWWDFGAGSTWADIIQPTRSGSDISALMTHLSDNGNTIENPMLNSISRQADGNLDPRPSADSPAIIANLSQFADPFYDEVSYKGAFCPSGLWIQGWTALSLYGYLNDGIEFCDAVGTNDVQTENDGFILTQNRPNPFTGTTEIAFSLPKSSQVSLTIFDINGKAVAQLMTKERTPAGEHVKIFDASQLAAGVYYYILQSNDTVLSRKMIVQ